ncbi:Aspyridones efflux protein [Sparassis crispa]|uniref:Aspyridones efflux protein n=1 Tax=Sparassis crispa TaxID=139825 RepID=A0A401GQZ2_9APHY|nr:Aspyridones efflux protein [Sparassis crispa]GBE84589.1 Aspyridones efflux protein [Sparassis crispa]
MARRQGPSWPGGAHRALSLCFSPPGASWHDDPQPRGCVRHLSGLISPSAHCRHSRRHGFRNPRVQTLPANCSVYRPSTPQHGFISISDGGFRAWLSVLGGRVLYMAYYAVRFYFTFAGAPTSSNLFLLFSVGLPAGKLFDSGYFHATTVFGTVFYVFSIFMLSLADFLKCYSSSLRVSAWASAVGYSSAFSIQAHRWKRRHSLAMGIVATGSGFGGIIYPIMLNQLFHIAVGFAWGVRAAAFPTPGLLIIANCVMTTCLPTAKASGLSPKPEFLMIFTDVAHVLPHRNFLVLWGVFFPYLYIQLWINEQGLSSTLGFYSISILNGSIFGRIIPNVAADYVGQFNRDVRRYRHRVR